MLAVSPAFAQDAAAPVADEAVATEDEIVVTGFRASLDKALDVKRDSVAAVDAIVARLERTIGSTQIDSSIRTRLNTLAQAMKG